MVKFFETLNWKKALKFILGVYLFAEFIAMIVAPIVKQGGWDHQIYCRAIEAMDNGLNPYLVENLGTTLSYTYPPLAAYFFKPVCSLPFYSYLLVQILVLAAIVQICVKRLLLPLVPTLLFVIFGFNAAKSNFLTGNLGLWEGLSFVLFLWLATSKSSRAGLLSNLGFGIFGYIKILPLGFNLLNFLGNPISKWKAQLKPLLLSASIFIGLWGASFLIYPAHSVSFVNQLIGKNTAQHSAIAETQANANNPTLLLWFKNIAEYVGNSGVFWLLLLVLMAISVLVFKKRVVKESDLLLRYTWSAWIVVMFLPRYKEYSFVYSALILLVIVTRKFPKTVWYILALTVLQRSLVGTSTNELKNLLVNSVQTWIHFALFVYFGLFADKCFKESSDRINNANS